MTLYPVPAPLRQLTPRPPVPVMRPVPADDGVVVGVTAEVGVRVGVGPATVGVRVGVGTAVAGGVTMVM